MKLPLILAAALTFSMPALAAEAPPTPTFGYVAPGWLQPLSFPLDNVWAAFGYPERGITNYSSAAPLGTSPYWERFNPESERYQAWFGTYAVTHFSFASEWTKRELTANDVQKSAKHLQELALADQFAWLAAYGDKTPIATVVPNSTHVFHLRDRWFVMSFELETQSDVGGTVPFPWVPPTSSRVASFESILVDAVYAFTFDEPSQTLEVVFFSGNTWQTNDGVQHATPLEVTLEQVRMVAATSFH